MITLANISALVGIGTAVIGASALVVGYYTQRIRALEAEGRIREIANELADASALFKGVEKRLKDAESERDAAIKERDDLQEKNNWLSHSALGQKQELDKAYRFMARNELKELIRIAEADNWSVPLVVLRFIEFDDCVVIDSLERTLNTLAPKWPIKKVRDDGSTLRQPEESDRLLFESSNVAFGQNAAMCIGRLISISSSFRGTEDDALTITLFPETNKTKA